MAGGTMERTVCVTNVSPAFTNVNPINRGEGFPASFSLSLTPTRPPFATGGGSRLHVLSAGGEADKLGLFFYFSVTSRSIISTTLDVGRETRTAWTSKERRTQMKKGGKVVAWVCIFSTVIMGCYSSAMIEPTGANKERVYSGEIHYLVTKDSTRYWFEKPPAIVKDTIVGEANFYRGRGLTTEKVSIPYSNVTMASVDESDPMATTFLVAGIVVLFLALGMTAQGAGWNLSGTPRTHVGY